MCGLEYAWVQENGIDGDVLQAGGQVVEWAGGLITM